MADEENNAEEVEPMDVESKVARMEQSLQDMQARLVMAELEAQGGELGNPGTMMQASEDEGIPTWLGGGGAGGSEVEGFFFILADGTTTIYVDYNDVIEDYDPTPTGSNHTDWSIEFAVSSSSISTTTVAGLAFNDTVALYDGDASASPVENQTKYRLPVVRDSKILSVGGVYRENIFCAGSKGPIVELVRIG